MTVSKWSQGREGRAEHLVYLEQGSKDLTKLLCHEKTMIIRGGTRKNSPLGGRAKVDDLVYLIEGGSDYMVAYRCVISKVIESEQLTSEEAVAFVDRFKKELNLTPAQYKRWTNKKFLGVYGLHQFEAIEPFKFKRRRKVYDWIITDNIEEIKDYS